MAKKLWRIQLACGHYTPGMESAERVAIRLAGSHQVCPVCGVPQALADKERRGGRKPTLWSESMANAQRCAELGVGKVTVRPDGLATRLLNPRGSQEWWCRLCDGKKPVVPPSPLRSMEAVMEEWGAHLASDQHQRELRSATLIGAIADKIASR